MTDPQYYIAIIVTLAFFLLGVILIGHLDDIKRRREQEDARMERLRIGQAKRSRR